LAAIDPALAQGLTWVFSQPREALARAAITAAEPFTAERILMRLYDAYRDLAAVTAMDADAATQPE
jgi:hypothetical protein